MADKRRVTLKGLVSVIEGQPLVFHGPEPEGQDAGRQRRLAESNARVFQLSQQLVDFGGKTVDGNAVSVFLLQPLQPFLEPGFNVRIQHHKSRVLLQLFEQHSQIGLHLPLAKLLFFGGSGSRNRPNCRLEISSRRIKQLTTSRNPGFISLPDISL